MAASGLLLVVVLGVGVPLVLYLLIRAETSDPTVVDRKTAERLARQRGGRDDAEEIGDHGPGGDRDAGEDAGWGGRDDRR